MENVENKNNIIEDKNDVTEQELNSKSIITGILVGVVALGLSIYLMTYVGMTVAVSPLSAFIGLVIFQVIRNKTTKRELNMVQTIASGVEAGCFGLVSSFAAAYMFGYELDWKIAIVILLIGGTIGICFISFLRKQMCNDETLAFPAAIACKNVIDKISNPPKDEVRMFIIFLLISLIFSSLQNIVKIIPPIVNLSSILPSSIYLDIALMPMLLGFGYLIGFKISSILLISSLIINLVLAPIGTSLGWYPGPGENFAVMQQFNLSLLVGVAMVGAIVPILKNWKNIFKSINIKNTKFDKNSKEVPTKILIVLLVIGVLIAIIFFKSVFDVNPLITLLTLICVMISAMVSIRVSAQSGIAIGGLLDMITILIVVTVLGDPIIGLLLIAMGTTITCLAADTMTDLKTGQLVNASPKKQIIGQFIGLIPGVILATIIVSTIISTKGVGSAEAPFPIAGMFYGLAGSASGALEGMINFSRVGIGAGLGAILAFIGLPASAISITFYLQPGFIIILSIGGFIKKYISDKKGSEAAEKINNAASGIIVGDAFIAVVTVFMMLFTS